MSYTYLTLSLGCKVNYYECQALGEILESKGFLKKENNPSLYIINTCTVTEEASKKSRKAIRRVKRENPDSVICVMGCLSQVDESLKDMSEIDILLGQQNKESVYQYFLDFINNKKQIVDINKDIFKSNYDSLRLSKFESHTRAFLKVEDGCTNFCSYCIIPFARGNVRSKPIFDCVSEVKELVSNGHKEIVISGIHTGAYGKDINSSLYELLVELDKIDGLKRIRISSIEINQITGQMIDLFKKSEKIVPHLHIPLQAASNHVLKLMNRHYTVEEFIERSKYLKKEIKDLNLTTDYIVGFPEETDEDFELSLDNLKQIGFSKIHTFPFSLRKGTKAEKMIQVSQEIKKERCHKVLSLSQAQEKDFMKSYLGQIVNVLFETLEDGYVYGHTPNYLYVKASGSLSDLNKEIKVKLIEVLDNCILGEKYE